MKSSISVIIPALYEEANLAATVDMVAHTEILASASSTTSA